MECKNCSQLIALDSLGVWRTTEWPKGLQYCMTASRPNHVPNGPGMMATCEWCGESYDTEKSDSCTRFSYCSADCEYDKLIDYCY
jgi:hypothetical protein